MFINLDGNKIVGISTGGLTTVRENQVIIKGAPPQLGQYYNRDEGKSYNHYEKETGMYTNATAITELPIIEKPRTIEDLFDYLDEKFAKLEGTGTIAKQ